ncbi:MAG: TfoX/Sxy family protein, partial [Patescibacteria group bacterium]
MKRNTEFNDYVIYDLLGSISGITSRAMFGGYGIYKNGIIFGIIIDDILYLKVDVTNQKEYEKYGSSPFSYRNKGKEIKMSYWEVPEEILENREKITDWAEESYRINKGSSGQSPEVLSELVSLPPQADGRATRYFPFVGSSARKYERLPARVYAQAGFHISLALRRQYNWVQYWLLG